MDLSQLEFIIRDSLKLPNQYKPYFGPWKEAFREDSYIRWAVAELLSYVHAHIHQERATIDDICDCIEEFSIMMIDCGPEKMFEIAEGVAEDVYDIIREMG